MAHTRVISVALILKAGIAALVLYSSVVASQTTAHAVASSDYVVQGISQTLGESSLQAGASYTHHSGFYTGVWVAENTFITSYYGNRRSLREVDYYVGWQTPTDDGSVWAATLSHYSYPGEPYYSNYRYNEFTASWQGANGLSATVGVADNLYDYDRRSGFAEVAYNRAINETLLLNTGLGYHDTEQLFGRSYIYWNIGLTRLMGRFAVDLNFIDTDSDATAIFGDNAAGSRWVVSVTAEIF